MSMVDAVDGKTSGPIEEAGYSVCLSGRWLMPDRGGTAILHQCER